MTSTSPTLVYCGYHKCLTVFVGRVFNRLLGDRYHEFFGTANIDRFYDEYRKYAVSATSDVKPDLSRLGDDYRIARFIRDPRDLVVSGYFYHRKGTEAWTRVARPRREAWSQENTPRALRSGESFAECLQRLDQEDGLIAEMEWREPHFRAMLQWPDDDPRIRLWKYEHILGREVEVMDQMGEHFGWPDDTDPFSFRAGMRRWADRWRMKDDQLKWDKHVRDPKAGQWRTVFTPKAHAAFNELFGDLPEKLGYDPA